MVLLLLSLLLLSPRLIGITEPGELKNNSDTIFVSGVPDVVVFAVGIAAGGVDVVVVGDVVAATAFVVTTFVVVAVVVEDSLFSSDLFIFTFGCESKELILLEAIPEFPVSWDATVKLEAVGSLLLLLLM